MCTSLFCIFLELHESRKPSSTHEVRNWLIRNEYYLPAMTASVMRYVLEPLTEANIDMVVLRQLQTTENTAVGPLAPRQAENTFCAPMHVNKVLS